MLVREQNATRFNRVLNHPDVRPGLGVEKPGIIDVTQIVENLSNVLLAGDLGGCLFLLIQEGIYECHLAVLPEGRGQWMQDVLRSAVNNMFLRTPAFEILFRVPDESVAMRCAVLAAGGRSQWGSRGTTVFSISILDWAMEAEDLTEIGRWLQDRLRTEAVRLGIEASVDDLDDNWRQFTGAAYALAKSGQPAKGVNLFGRFASLDRRPMPELISIEPPTIRLAGFVLTMRDGDIEVSRPC